LRRTASFDVLSVKKSI